MGTARVGEGGVLSICAPPGGCAHGGWGGNTGEICPPSSDREQLARTV